MVLQLRWKCYGCEPLALAGLNRLPVSLINARPKTLAQKADTSAFGSRKFKTQRRRERRGNAPVGTLRPQRLCVSKFRILYHSYLALSFHISVRANSTYSALLQKRHQPFDDSPVHPTPIGIGALTAKVPKVTARCSDVDRHALDLRKIPKRVRRNNRVVFSSQH